MPGVNLNDLILAMFPRDRHCKLRILHWQMICAATDDGPRGEHVIKRRHHERAAVQMVDGVIFAIALGGCTARKYFRNFLDRRATIGFVPLGRWSSCRLTEVLLWQSCNPNTRCWNAFWRAYGSFIGSNPTPIKSLNRKRLLFAEVSYFYCGNRKPDLAHELRTKPLVLDLV